MKKMLIALLGVLMVPAALAQFKEGTHYEQISKTGSAKPQVQEFFSFYCGHCFRFEPVAETLKAGLPEGVPFEKNHVSFIGGNMGQEMTRAFATAEVLKVKPTVVQTIFSDIHEHRKRFANRDDVRKIFLENGVSGEQFDSAVNSFVVNGMVMQMEKNTSSYNIRGVPALIVNGKYQINTASVKSVDELQELVNFLVSQ